MGEGTRPIDSLRAQKLGLLVQLSSSHSKFEFNPLPSLPHVHTTPIIDAHTHCYPESVIANPRAWAETNGEHHWAELVAPTARSSIQGWASPTEMLRAMDVAGIETSVLLAWYWEHAATCRWHNKVIADWVQTAPDRFIGFAAIHLGDSSEDTLAQLDYAHSLGLSGVGELHPGVQHFNAQSNRWNVLADWCVRHNWPVNLHATEAVGHEHPGAVPTPLQDFVRMASGHPELKIILSHWGGGLPFFEQNPRIRQKVKNLRYDCSASPLLYSPSVYRQIIDLVGIEKCIFGSDYPLRLFPKHEARPTVSSLVNEITEHAELSESEAASFYRNNFLQLFE